VSTTVTVVVKRPLNRKVLGRVFGSGCDENNGKELKHKIITRVPDLTVVINLCMVHKLWLMHHNFCRGYTSSSFFFISLFQSK
jgi:hypothetical protein